jgi:DNA topoisomerase-3
MGIFPDVSRGCLPQVRTWIRFQEIKFLIFKPRVDREYFSTRIAPIFLNFLMNILCVAEKPSISKTVAQILSGGTMETCSTRNQYIKNYKFNAMSQSRQCQLTMTALLGHLTEYQFESPNLKTWNSATNELIFHAKIIKKVKDDMKALETNLKNLARTCQMLVIWTDCDREGENIGAEVASVCQSVNPNIIIKRAKFSVVQKRLLFFN